MNISKLKLLVAIVTMPIVLCSCPGHNCEEENVPKGYVVRMKNDYSGNVMVRVFVGDLDGDTSYCCPSVKNHTLNITGEYYVIHSQSYDIAAYTSIDCEDWDDELMESIGEYIIDFNPYEEVYAYYGENYSVEELKDIVEHDKISKFERLK